LSRGWCSGGGSFVLFFFFFFGVKYIYLKLTTV